MKTNNFKTILYSAIIGVSALSCTNDDDFKLAPYIPIAFAEDFNGVDNTILAIEGWTNFAEQGTAKWKFQKFGGNGYGEFSAFQSPDASCVGWLISPAVSLKAGNLLKLRFQVSQSFVSSSANKLETLISTDYDGTNVTTATWEPLNANIPGTDAEYFKFMDSGLIDLSGFSGDVYIAFKYTGSGTNSSLDGSYQIDSVRIY